MANPLLVILNTTSPPYPPATGSQVSFPSPGTRSVSVLAPSHFLTPRPGSSLSQEPLPHHWLDRSLQFVYPFPTRSLLQLMFSDLGWATGDIIAGLTVGLVLVPQSMSYAKIANLPPQYGLYSSFVGVFIYCVTRSFHRLPSCLTSPSF